MNGNNSLLCLLPRVWLAYTAVNIMLQQIIFQIHLTFSAIKVCVSFHYYGRYHFKARDPSFCVNVALLACSIHNINIQVNLDIFLCTEWLQYGDVMVCCQCLIFYRKIIWLMVGYPVWLQSLHLGNTLIESCYEHRDQYEASNHSANIVSNKCMKLLSIWQCLINVIKWKDNGNYIYAYMHI